MILPVFTLFIEPANPLQFSLPEARSSLTRQLAEYRAPHQPGAPAGNVIHRYPAVQCKQVRHDLVVIGICQGAGFLRQMVEGNAEIMTGDNRCTIASRDPEIRNEEFGIGPIMYEYEFLTPWIALNQQYAKKFYDLKGKPARDAFMQKILATHLNTLAKSLDYAPAEPVTCMAHVRFIRERIDRENVIVFLGKFRTNLRIPDYFGIGQSVSLGYGTIRKIPEMIPSHPDVDAD
ncbi:MAG: CRISPR-associated endonuclease Cas6 [Methanoregula sp.]|jgi:hypothetical protein|uniref:CRISPR-associated endonuclease Cas6 n=1 Tax=Methanoregula sp. TaxID=2052170 RepID=UPI0025FC3B1B|nr:CRISPR-associated endonuclease Cas6 [Methanoregula sp.]MCK9630379.1 CRISPR-associated endonuclease Cas6 [Methanoregula sp.]